MNTKGLTALLAICLMAFSGICWAQDDQPKTLVGDGKVRISGFGGPIIEFSSVNGTPVVGAGGGGAAIFNNIFYFGGYGTGFSKTNIRMGNETIDLEFGHGGFWLGYIIRPNNIVHAVVSTKLGWGEITEFTTGQPRFVSESVFVTQPQLEVELNITLWFKVNVGLGYRWVTSQDITQLGMSGIAGNINFLFGWFGTH